MQSSNEKSDEIRSYYCASTGQNSKLYCPPLMFFLSFWFFGIFIWL